MNGGFNLNRIIKGNFIISFVSGFLFALGLGISGMTQPSKVQGFLDVFGHWDPTLAFVMLGAVLSHALVYRFMKGRSSPLLGGSFSIPNRRDVDRDLVLGAAIFGIGWGLAGLCPGPALASLATGRLEVYVFTASMLGGMLLSKRR